MAPRPRRARQEGHGDRLRRDGNYAGPGAACDGCGRDDAAAHPHLHRAAAGDRHDQLPRRPGLKHRARQIRPPPGAHPAHRPRHGAVPPVPDLPQHREAGVPRLEPPLPARRRGPPQLHSPIRPVGPARLQVPRRRFLQGRARRGEGRHRPHRARRRRRGAVALRRVHRG